MLIDDSGLGLIKIDEATKIFASESNVRRRWRSRPQHQERSLAARAHYLD